MAKQTAADLASNQNPHRRKIIADVCCRYPEVGNRTLARKLNNEYPAHFPSLRIADGAIRWFRGNRGSRSRKTAVINGTARTNRNPGQLAKLPDTSAKPWVPFVVNARRSLVLSDLHVPFHHKGAIRAAIKYGKEFKPDAVIINGDFFDFYQLSRFDKNPTIEGVDYELACGKRVLAHLRQEFPKAQFILKKGNHDERWATYVHACAPRLAGVRQIVDGWMDAAGIHEYGVTVVGEQRPIMLGKLPVLHGHELGKGISSPVNPARGAFLRTHHTILVRAQPPDQWPRRHEPLARRNVLLEYGVLVRPHARIRAHKSLELGICDRDGFEGRIVRRAKFANFQGHEG